MRRLARYILNALTVLSLVLCVATMVLWVRSDTVPDIFWHKRFWTTTNHAILQDRMVIVRVTSYKGRLVLARDWEDNLALDDQPIHFFNDEWRLQHHIGTVFLPDPTRWGRIGFYFTHQRRLLNGRMTGGGFWAIGTPHWLAAMILSLAPLVRLMRHLRRESFMLPGHCPTCGYDLRATPDRCPECGTPQKK